MGVAVATAATAAEKPNFEKETLPASVLPPQVAGRIPGGRNVIERVEAQKAKVAKIWETIVFEKDGKPVTYAATLDTDLGPIDVVFYPDVAPIHVRSFIALSKAGFFDGLIFHRCIPGFVIQGGCPAGQGFGGPGYQLPAEFNDKKHGRGILSMARSNDPNSAGSQFFICTDDGPGVAQLDGKYTVFGKVTKGMDVVDKIVAKPRGAQDRPDEPVHIRKVTIREK